MLKTLKRLLVGLRSEDHEGIVTPANEDATFHLRYGPLLVGTLQLHGGTWKFVYAEDFKRQSEVQPLIDFPDLEKQYDAHALWPFFMARIPSVSQPKVRELIAAEGLDEHSDVQLLRRFGKQTISNPFVLLESSQLAPR